jgi:hypothetical protein
MTLNAKNVLIVAGIMIGLMWALDATGLTDKVLP